jgi:hypothetical protein
MFGCSITGPGNAGRGVACQDAWASRRWASPQGDTRAIAIADGMGSKAHSRHGAKAAVRVALKAARRWANHPEIGTDWLIRWIEAEWRYAIAGHDPVQCCSTCWLAVCTPTAGILVMGLGDGIALVQESGHPVQLWTGRNLLEFTNTTLALGSPHKASDWQVHQLASLQKPWKLALATDGISEDLDPEKMPDFTIWLDQIGRLRLPARALRRALASWPVPAHSDDKTLAVITSD